MYCSFFSFFPKCNYSNYYCCSECRYFQKCTFLCHVSILTRTPLCFAHFAGSSFYLLEDSAHPCLSISEDGLSIFYAEEELPISALASDENTFSRWITQHVLLLKIQRLKNSLWHKFVHPQMYCRIREPDSSERPTLLGGPSGRNNRIQDWSCLRQHREELVPWSKQHILVYETHTHSNQVTVHSFFNPAWVEVYDHPKDL